VASGTKFKISKCFSKKHAEALKLFRSLKLHPVNLETICACTESIDLILEDFKSNFYWWPSPFKGIKAFSEDWGELS
jgi:hypothetical protein